MVRITETSNISQYEKEKFKKEPDFLLVGKQDKSINIVSQGDKIPIKELPIFNRTGSLDGIIKIPSSDGSNFIIQYGIKVMPSNSTQTFSFHEPFPNQMLQLIPTLKDGAGDVFLKVPITSNSTFDVTNSGATSTNINFYWFAIGY